MLEDKSVLIVTLISFAFTIFVLFYFLSLSRNNKVLKIFLIVSALFTLFNNTYSIISISRNGNLLIHTFLLNYIILFSVLISHNKNQEILITRDELTGLNNRFALARHLENIRNQEKAYLIVGDIDKFKFINDKKGHNEGDRILKVVSNALKEVGKKYPRLFISRYGGDEFVFVYSSGNKIELKNVIEDLNNVVKLRCSEIGYDVSMSFGYSIYEKSNFNKSFKEADLKMYEVKKNNIN